MIHKMINTRKPKIKKFLCRILGHKYVVVKTCENVCFLGHTQLEYAYCERCNKNFIRTTINDYVHKWEKDE